jgi:myo-inositol-1(or 4)-monophosphatase
MLPKKDLKLFQNSAERIAKEAGKILLSYRKKFIIKKHKQEYLDIATNADYASESFIVKKLKKLFPNHNIFSEENINENLKKSFYQWIVDPLDGTKEYIRRLPYYSINIALEFNGKLIVGVVYHPELNRLYSASLNNQAQLNKQNIRVSKEQQLDKSYVYFRLPDYRMPKEKILQCLKIYNNFTLKVFRTRNIAWDIDSLCHVALGAVEGFILPSTKNWCPPKWHDVAPGILIVQGAGGRTLIFTVNLLLIMI